MPNMPMLTEKEILAKIKGQPDLYAPLQIASIEEPEARLGYRPDARITITLQNRKVVLLAEIKARTAPKLIEEALWRIRRVAAGTGSNFLIVVPYLSPSIVELLNREKVNGIDLNGNYLIQVPEILAMRLDQKNRFPESQPIKKIFTGSSSLVGRLFLATWRPFQSGNEVLAGIKDLGGTLSQSAVSKVLKGLEEELIIEKGPNGISLLQPEKLLQKLGENYRQPRISGSVKLKLPGISAKANLKMTDELRGIIGGGRWIISGESSARRYAVMADTSVLKIYLTDNSSLLKYQDDRFYNVLAQTTDTAFPYFDARENKGLRWASPVQCWLELSKLDKREREIADGVREVILERSK
jgi:hypothetical protein